MEVERGSRLFSQDGDVVLVYLYGSQTKGTTHPLSDVDVAILLDKRVKEKDYLDKQLEYMRKLEPIFESDKVIVAILNEVTVLLAYEVIRYGEVLYARSEGERVKFEVKVMREYFDTERMREVNDYFLFKYIKEGRFGYRYRKYQETIRQNKGRIGFPESSR